MQHLRSASKFTCKGVSLTCSAQADQASVSLAMAVKCLSKRVIGSNKLRNTIGMQISQVHRCPCKSCLPTYQLLPAWFAATTREMIALSLFKGATKSKDFAVPKGSCENRMSGELAAKFAPAESNISVFCDAFWETKFKLRNFQKETGITNCLQPRAVNCIRWTTTSVKREVAS